MAGAEDDALDFFGLLDCVVFVGGVGDQGAEGGVGTDKVLDVGAGEGVAEEGLGEEDDEGCVVLFSSIQNRRFGNLRLRNWRCIWRRRAWNRLAGSVK